MTAAKRHWIGLTIVLFIAGTVFGALAGMLIVTSAQQRFAFLYTDMSIQHCLDARHPLADRAAPAEEDEILLCYNQLVGQMKLIESQIRHVNFQNQYVANNVVLWMVVAMTIAGVSLAGFQIVASARLSTASGAAPDATEISIEQGRLFLRSSITGLFILIVSFAFFYTYVIFVYTIHESDAVPRSRASVSSGQGSGEGRGTEGGDLLIIE